MSSYPQIDLKKPREPISLREALQLVGIFAGKEPTPKQYMIVDKIQSALESGYKKILLSAPTGTGKSWIAIALSLYMRSATILTSTVLLQDQYKNEFGFFNTVRGKKRFLCEQTNRVFDCTHGYCADCEFKPKSEHYSVLKKGTIAEKVTSPDVPRKCAYYDQIEIGKKSSFVVYSYASYLSHLLSGEEVPSRRLLVCDEAHELDEELANQLSTSLSGFYGKLLGLDMPKFSLQTGIDQVVRYVADFSEEFKKREPIIKRCAEHTLYLQSAEHVRKHAKCAKHSLDLSDNCTFCKKIKEYIKAKEFLKCTEHIDCKFDHRYINHFVLNELKNYATKVKILHKGLVSANQNYIITDVHSSSAGKNYDEITIKPWHIHWFIDELCSNFDVTLFMSATINLELFCKETGFNKEEIYFINEDSDIPVENRKVVFLKTDYVESNSELVLSDKIISQIEAILKLRSSQRGIILLTSYSQMDYILNNISVEYRGRLLPVLRDQDKSELISLHRMSPNSVLISPGLESGVNLVDEDSRFQIIVKAPYYPTADDLRMKKIYESESSHRRYYLKSAFRLLQMAGRSIRHRDDYAMTYVLDAKAERMIHYQRNDLPDWFLKACEGLST